MLALILLVCATLTACAPTEPSVPPIELIGVPTQPRLPDDQTPPACPPATIEGRLVADAVAGVALEEPNGRRRSVIWPFGYALRPGDPPALLDAEGEVVALIGDLVELTGGEDSGGAWRVCP
jgi:hypothetical protein